MFSVPVAAVTNLVVSTPDLGLLLDASGLPVSLGAYSLRRLDKDYSGPCLKVIRQSDNATQDIFWTSGHVVDTAAITTFCGASPGFVQVWYDQSTNGNHLIQNAIANMFRIWSGTAIDSIGGKTALFAPDQSRGMITAPFTRWQGSKATAVCVGSIVSGTTTNSPRYVSFLPTTTTLGDTEPIGALMIARNTTLEQWGINRAGGWRATYPGNFGQLEQVCSIIDGTTHTIAVDGREVAGTFATAANLDVSRIAIGHTGFQPQSVGGSYRSEIICWPTALTQPQQDLVAANQRTAYGLSIGPEPEPPTDPEDPDPTPTPTVLNWTAMGYETIFFDDFKEVFNYTLDTQGRVYPNTVNQTHWKIFGDNAGTTRGNEGRGFRKISQLTVDPTGVGRALIRAEGEFSSGLYKRGSNNTQRKYGGYEVRFKLPPGYGYGIAILLWPMTDNWPTDGEVDVVEIPKGMKDAKLHTTLHIGKGNRQSPKVITGDWTKWHTVSWTWTATEFVFWMDGKEYWRNNDLSFQPPGPMWLGIQYDVGGYAGDPPKLGWIAVRDATTPQPSILEIDYVRILRKVGTV